MSDILRIIWLFLFTPILGKGEKMNKLLFVGIVGCALAAQSSALIYVDYVNDPDSPTTINIGNYDNSQSLTQIFNLSSSGGNYILGGSGSGVYVGAYKFVGLSTKVLCVELNAPSTPGQYGYKAVSGYAGWLVSKISGLSSAVEAAGLAIATWEINYDSTDYNLGGAGLDLGTGKFRFVGSTASGTAGWYAQQFLAQYDADNTKRGYRYYHNPIGSDAAGSQDYIGVGGPGETGEPVVPAPAAFIPFALGFLKAIRRRK